MASVSSLDHDVRNLRLSRYTPQAANQTRQWIQDTLGSPLPPGDLLDALKDGVALCRLANLVLPAPGLKFKSSPMPFVQMENISHFLRACEMPPLNMPAHDRFLTVDLYENKDPAQVIQCLAAFSRQAHAARPDVVRNTIGPKNPGSHTISTSSLHGSGNGVFSARSVSPTKSFVRPMSPALTGGSQHSASSATARSSPGPVSSWSKRTDEGATVPAWNIAQYGYMGGASQGNQGISFGARRQITSQAPAVPVLAEKERRRKEKVAEEESRRQEEEEMERRRRAEQEAEEQREREEEERRWEEETARLREEERRRLEQQKQQWAEEERRWKEQEEARRKEEGHLSMSARNVGIRPGGGILRGQTLSEYQREQATAGGTASPEQQRVADLERQLEEAREREKQYLAEREQKERSRPGTARPEPSTAAPPLPSPPQPDRNPDLHPLAGAESPFTRPVAAAAAGAGPPPSSPRPPPRPVVETSPGPENHEPTGATPDTRPAAATHVAAPAVRHSPFVPRHRPLPTPGKAASTPAPRTPATTRAAPSSLLEREMERERERQREWEAQQTGTPAASSAGGAGHRREYVGGGAGDYVGSGSGGFEATGPRRQLLGPRRMGTPREDVG